MFEVTTEIFVRVMICGEKPSVKKKKIVIPWKILRMGGIKTKYHRNNGVFVG